MEFGKQIIFAAGKKPALELGLEFERKINLLEQTVKDKDSAIECYKNEREHLEQRIAELESENVQLQAAVSKLETTQPKWHQCEHPDSEGFYDLPPESGEYIVQVRSRSGRPETFAAEFDADYSDWTDLINGTVVIQWCEEPKPLDKTCISLEEK